MKVHQEEEDVGGNVLLDAVLGGIRRRQPDGESRRE